MSSDPQQSFVSKFLEHANQRKESVKALHFDKDGESQRAMTDSEKFAVTWRLVAMLEVPEPDVRVDGKYKLDDGTLLDCNNRVQVLIDEGDYVPALHEVNAVISSMRKEDAVLWFETRAEVLANMGRWLEVVEDIDYIIERIGLDNVDAKMVHRLYCGKGKAYVELGRWGIAAKSYRDAAAHLEWATGIGDEEVGSARKTCYERLEKTCREKLRELQQEILKPPFSTQVPGSSRGAKRLVGKNGATDRAVFPAAYKVNKTPGGRPYLEAARDVQPGLTAVMDEPPFVSGLQDYCYGTHCHRCGVFCNHYVIPCECCTAIAYCSVSCSKAHWNTHRIECSILPGLKQENVCRVPQLLALRALLKRTATEWQSIAKATNYGQDGNAADGLDGLGLKIPTEEQGQAMEELAHYLSSVGSSPSVGLMLDLTLRAGYVLKLLKRTPFWVDMPKNEEELNELEIFLGGLLYRYMLIFKDRFVGIYESVTSPVTGPEGDENSLSVSKKRIGYGVYPELSLLSHSCAPNAVMVFHGFLVLVYPIRPINAGEPITVSYRNAFYEKPRLARQAGLLKFFGRACNCQACCEDWPLPGPKSPVFECNKATIKDLSSGTDGKLRWPCCKIEITDKDFAGGCVETCPKKCPDFVGDELRILIEVFERLEDPRFEESNECMDESTTNDLDASKLAKLMTDLTTGVSLLSKYAEKPYHPVLWRWIKRIAFKALTVAGSNRTERRAIGRNM